MKSVGNTVALALFVAAAACLDVAAATSHEGQSSFVSPAAYLCPKDLATNDKYQVSEFSHWPNSAKCADVDAGGTMDYSTRQFTAAPMLFADQHVDAEFEIIEWPSAWCENGCQGPPNGTTFTEGQAFITFDKLYVTSDCYTCGYATLSRKAREAGAGGFLFFQEKAALVGCETQIYQSATNRAFMRDLPEGERFPVLEIPGSVMQWLLPPVKNGTSVKLHIVADSDTEWEALWRSWYVVFWSFGIGGANIWLIFLACDKLRFFVKKSKGFKLGNIPQMAIAFMIPALLVQLAHAAIDPLFSRGIFPFPVSRMMITLNIPFSMVPTVMIMSFWKQVTSKNMSGGKKGQLSATTTRVLTVVGLFVALGDLATSLIDGYTGATTSGIMGMVMALFQLTLGTMYLVMGSRLLKMLAKNAEFSRKSAGKESNAAKRSQAAIVRMSRSVVRTGIALLFCVVFIVVATRDPILFDPWGRFITCGLVLVFYSLIMYFELNVFATGGGHTQKKWSCTKRGMQKVAPKKVPATLASAAPSSVGSKTDLSDDANKSKHALGESTAISSAETTASSQFTTSAMTSIGATSAIVHTEQKD